MVGCVQLTGRLRVFQSTGFANQPPASTEARRFMTTSCKYFSWFVNLPWVRCCVWFGAAVNEDDEGVAGLGLGASLENTLDRAGSLMRSSGSDLTPASPAAAVAAVVDDDASCCSSSSSSSASVSAWLLAAAVPLLSGCACADNAVAVAVAAAAPSAVPAFACSCPWSSLFCCPWSSSLCCCVESFVFAVLAEAVVVIVEEEEEEEEAAAAAVCCCRCCWDVLEACAPPSASAVLLALGTLAGCLSPSTMGPVWAGSGLEVWSMTVAIVMNTLRSTSLFPHKHNNQKNEKVGEGEREDEQCNRE